MSVTQIKFALHYRVVLFEKMTRFIQLRPNPITTKRLVLLVLCHRRRVP